ncbi:MAG: T9SS type A sorting domain-containing protein [Bacteroidota bacterium]
MQFDATEYEVQVELGMDVAEWYVVSDDETNALAEFTNVLNIALGDDRRRAERWECLLLASQRFKNGELTPIEFMTQATACDYGPSSSRRARSLGISNPKSLDLQIFPNPAKGLTQFTFSLPQTSQCRIELWDMQGRRLREILPDRELTAGQQQFVFDVSTLADGVYSIRLRYGDQQVLKPFVVR